MRNSEEHAGDDKTVSTFDPEATDYAVTLQDINEVLGFIGLCGSEESQDTHQSEIAIVPSRDNSVFTFALESDVISTLALARDLDELDESDEGFDELDEEDIASVSEYIANRENRSSESSDDNQFQAAVLYRYPPENDKWYDDRVEEEDDCGNFDTSTDMSDDAESLIPDSSRTLPASSKWLQAVAEEDEETMDSEGTLKPAPEPAQEPPYQSLDPLPKVVGEPAQTSLHSTVETDNETMALESQLGKTPKPTPDPHRPTVEKDTMMLKRTPVQSPKPGRKLKPEPRDSSAPRTVKSSQRTIIKPISIAAREYGEIAIPRKDLKTQDGAKPQARHTRKEGKHSRQYKAAKMYKKRVTFSSKDIDEDLFKMRHEWVMKAVAVAKKRKKRHPEAVIVTIGTATDDAHKKDTWKLKKSVGDTALQRNDYIDLIQHAAEAGKKRLEKRYGPSSKDLSIEEPKAMFSANVIVERHSFTSFEDQQPLKKLERKTSWSIGDPLPSDLPRAASFRVKKVQTKTLKKPPNQAAIPIAGPNPLMREMLFKAKQRQARVQDNSPQMRASISAVPRTKTPLPLVDEDGPMLSQDEPTDANETVSNDTQVTKPAAEVKKRRSLLIAGKQYFKFSSRNKRCAEF
jgi:hypothetical protein